MQADLTPLTEGQRKKLKNLNVSDSIRYLDAEGFSRSEIARILGKRYQHVRNVLVRSTASGARRKSFAVTVSSDVLKEFRSLCNDLVRPVDGYLTDVLAQGLSALSEMQPNSPETERVLVEYYKGEGGTYGNAPSTTTESFKLDSELVKKVLKKCERMRVPVDLFTEAVLSTANDAMSNALQTVMDPFQFCKAMGAEYLLDYVISDDDAMRLREFGSAYDLLISAIAEIKNVSISAASNSVSRLSRADIETLKANPEIRNVINRLKKTDVSEVELNDLL